MNFYESCYAPKHKECSTFLSFMSENSKNKNKVKIKWKLN